MTFKKKRKNKRKYRNCGRTKNIAPEMLTKKGHSKLINELEELKTKRHPKAVKRLERARSMGDLSENSEYHAAKEELSFIVERIKFLEAVLTNVTVVNEEKNNTIVQLGDIVVLKNGKEVMEMEIVGEFESNPLKGKISHNSPIGKALLGKKVNEIVEVVAPAGKVTYEIIEIK